MWRIDSTYADFDKIIAELHKDIHHHRLCLKDLEQELVDITIAKRANRYRTLKRRIPQIHRYSSSSESDNSPLEHKHNSNDDAESEQSADTCEHSADYNSEGSEESKLKDYGVSQREQEGYESQESSEQDSSEQNGYNSEEMSEQSEGSEEEGSEQGSSEDEG